MEAIRLDNDTLAWLSEALRGSQAEEKKYHADMVKGLQNEVRTLQNRLHAMYVDHLDQKVTPEFYEAKRFEWNRQVDEMLEQIQLHERADRSYLAEGADLLELVQRMITLYEKQESFEKRKLLNFVVSNSVWKDGQLTVKFKKPFDLLAKTIAEEGKKFQPDEGKPRQAEKWLGC